VGSDLGIPDEKLLALADADSSLADAAGSALGQGTLFDERERAAIAYADAMTRTDRDVDDAVFARLQALFTDDELVELTAVIAWENASSTFNRALRVPSQGLWKRSGGEGG